MFGVLFKHHWYFKRSNAHSLYSHGELYLSAVVNECVIHPYRLLVKDIAEVPKQCHYCGSSCCPL